MGLLSRAGMLGMLGGNNDAMAMGLLPMLLNGGGLVERQEQEPGGLGGAMGNFPGGSAGGFLGAFANSPAFQNQLSQIMQGQGPGSQTPQMIAQPQTQVQPVNLTNQNGRNQSRNVMGGMPFMRGMFSAF